MKKLVICPICETKGKKEILGEIDDNRNFAVLRHGGTNTGSYSVIKGNNLMVECGKCGEVIYKKL